MGLPQPEGYLFWYTTSAILGVLTIVNILRITLRYFALKSRAASLPQLESAPSSPDTSSRSGSIVEKDAENMRLVRRLGPVERFGRVFNMAFSKFIGLSTIPLPKLRWWIKRKQGSSIATMELAWTIVYTLGCLLLSFYGTNLKDHKTYANQAGWISAAQMPLIIALAGKNNLISFLTGIGYEKLNFLHRAAGRVCFLGIWIHAGAYFYILEGFHSENWATSLSRWGFTGLLAFTLLNITSLRWVRQKIYEFFLITHILLAALTLAAFIMHWRAVGKWIYPGIGLWAADRLFRILRLFILNKLWTVIPSPTAANLPSTATLTLLTPSTLKISFQTPSPHLSWAAGQHFYVVMPGMARLPWEAHPFTASTIPKHPGSGTESGELTFIVRVRDGFTKRMKKQVDKERKAQGLGVEEECKIEVKAAVEGPYGHVRKMDMYDGVLVVAGGSGVSFAVSHLLQVIRDAKEGKPHPRYFSVIWMVKSRLHLNWIAPILLAHAQGIPSTLHVALHVHVTRQYIPRPSISLPSATSALPADPQTGDDSWQDYIAKRAAEPPRRRSRIYSTMSWATWTDPNDPDSQTGPGTRRGSTAVLPGQVSRGSVDKNAAIDWERRTSDAAHPFTWAKGYNEGETPDRDMNNSPGPGSPRRKQASSGTPSFATLQEDDETEGQERYGTQYEEPPRSSLDGGTTFARSTPRPSITMPESPRRASLALHSSPLNPHTHPVTRKTSTGILLATPPKRHMSISIEEPFIAGRRRSSVHSAGTPSSPGDSRRGSGIALGGPRRKSSGLLNVVLPEIDSPPVIDEEKDLGAGMFNILPPTPMPDENGAVLKMPAPAFFDADAAFLEAPLMIKTSSQHSGISIRSISSTGTPSSMDPLIRSHSPNDGSSGIATPALSVQPTDLSMPSDPEHPGQLLEQAFAESSQQRARQSVGLEQVVFWHEGRADLHKAIEGMMVSVGKGGTVNVEACGPRSLLDKAKDVVQDLSDMKAVWKGETRVIYHAETFGW